LLIAPAEPARYSLWLAGFSLIVVWAGFSAIHGQWQVSIMMTISTLLLPIRSLREKGTESRVFPPILGKQNTPFCPR
jgi:hypothetical protein